MNHNNADGILYDAQKDAEAAVNLFVNIDASGIVSFHAQQAAEKMVKHVFELNGVEYRKIHDIDKLLVEAINYRWLRNVSCDEIENARLLSLCAVFGRYAGALTTRDDALEAIERCNKIADILEQNGYPAVRINV